MVLGIGTDIIEIERIAKAFQKQKMIDKCFTESEQQYLKYKNMESYAGNFSCKEAVSKALGTGFRGFYFKDIEVLRDKYGKPFVNLYNNALLIANDLKVNKIHVTISHCKKYAVAYVIIEKNDCTQNF